LLRWSGLRAGDAACLPKSKVRDDDSLFLYHAKVKGKASAPVYVLLPPDVAKELRRVPPGSVTHPSHFFWSGRSKRKSEVSNWEKIFAKVVSKARQMFPNQHLAHAALASLMCSGLLRVLESFSNQAAWNNPDRYWISILTLVNWVGNVPAPIREVWR
jgi:hypothetical protein